ncbi:hypothetical protein ATN83_5186 [Raoultella ornithinolytica]|nr:hypothetical protein ATN83_5186 [Raoultella ornithinolytica]
MGFLRFYRYLSATPNLAGITQNGRYITPIAEILTAIALLPTSVE